jgi:cytochrome c-type biogenesis protein CcmH/NrfF
MLKNMVENIVSSYKCPFCGGKDISEKNIDII